MSGTAPDPPVGAMDSIMEPPLGPEVLGEHRQVSGSRLTLSEAIRTGEILRPELMGWQGWQPWRTNIGRRPTMRNDGYVLPPQIETSLWRATMTELYGSEWAMLLTLREADEGRRVGARRLREAESRREELLGAQGIAPALEDIPRPSAGALPPVPLEVTPNTESLVQSPAPETREGPLTPRTRTQPTEPPPRPTLTVRPAVPVEASTGVEANAYSSAVQIGSKALKPHDASKESYDAYVERLDKYQEELRVLEIPLPSRVYEGLLDKARLEEQSYHQHAQDGLMSPQERKRAQIITLQQELVAEELDRSGGNPARERKVEALYAILRD